MTNFPEYKSFFFLEPSHFPDITICPFPSFDEVKIKEFGYHNLFEYSKGIMRIEGWKKFKGWIGYGNYSMETIARNISTIKDIKEIISFKEKT